MPSKSAFRRWSLLFVALPAAVLLGAVHHVNPIELATLDGALLAKARPDECFVAIGVRTPINEDGSCDEGIPKVNQSYVWSLAKTRARLWGGSGPNVLCLVSGTLLGTGTPIENDAWVCEYGEGPYVPPLSAGVGDWRPGMIFSYDLIADRFVDRTPDDPRIGETLGMRAAGASPDYVYVGGPGLGGGINLFAYDAVSGRYLGSKHLPEFNNIRKWLYHEGVLYTAVGNTAGGGSVLRFDADPSAPDFPFDYHVVGVLNGDGSELAVHEGRLFASTWPNLVSGAGFPAPGAIWMSPPIPTGGLSDANANPASGEPQWQPVFSYEQYDPDLVTAIATGMGALASFDGYLYFGPMHVPGVGLFAHQIAAQQFGYPIDPTETLLNSSRAIAIFRGRDFGTADQKVELVYGSAALPAFNPFRPGLGWSVVPNSMGQLPLFGPSGFGNIFNNYTWGMQVYRGELYVVTMDWSFIANKLLAGGGFPPIPVPIDPEGYGADVWRFPSANEPAVLESKNGFGNPLNYGGRMLLADDAFLYLGSANAMNLRAGADDEHKGGWELLKFLPRGESPARTRALLARERAGGEAR